MNKLILLIPIFLLACTSGDDSEQDATDSTMADIEDTIGLEVIDEDTTTFIETEEEEAERKVVLKELPKTTFCDCIKKQNEINKKLEKAETDAEIDAVLAEMDKFTEGECKNLMAGDRTSPSARAEHMRKVAECL